MTDNLIESDFEKHFGKNGCEPQFTDRVANPDYRFKWTMKNLVPGSVLDIGCADGAFMKIMLDNKISEVAGMDVSEKARYATKQNTKANVYSSLEIIKDKSYDNVVCMQTIEHTDHPGLFFKAIAKIAKKRIIFTVPYENLLPDPMHKFMFHIYSVCNLVTQQLGEEADYDLYIINKIKENDPPNIFAVVVRLDGGKQDDDKD